MREIFEKTLKQYLTASIETKHIIKDCLFDKKRHSGILPAVKDMIINGQKCLDTGNEQWKEQLKDALAKPPAFTITSENIAFLLLMLDAYTADQKKELVQRILGKKNEICNDKLERISKMILKLIPEIPHSEKIAIIKSLTDEINEYQSELWTVFHATKAIAPQAEIIISAENMQPDLPGLDKSQIGMNLTLQEQKIKRGHHSSEIAVNISPITMKMTEITPDATPVDVLTSILPEELTNITLGAPEGLMENKMTYYDRRVEDAIGNLFQDGFKTISADMVYRQMNGLPSDKKVSEASCQKINDSISKLQVTYVKINVPDQKSREYPQIQRLKWAGFDTPMESAEIELRNGQTAVAYQIYNMPMIYKYSQMTNFSAKVPKIILNTDGVRNSDEVNNIRYCIIQIIEQIRRNIHVNYITYDEIYHIVGDEIATKNDTAGKVVRSKRIGNIQSLLDDFVNKGYIEHYENMQQKGRKTGVVVQLFKKQKLIK